MTPYKRWRGPRLPFAGENTHATFLASKKQLRPPRVVRSIAVRASGTIDVYDAGVRLEVTLPWLLARFAQAAQRVIGHKGMLMLEKK